MKFLHAHVLCTCTCTCTCMIYIATFTILAHPECVSEGSLEVSADAEQ